MTISMVPGQVIQEQGTNDLVGALQNVPGVYAFTNYGIYEGYTFRGFLDLFPSLANQLLDGVRLPRQGDRWNSVSASSPGGEPFFHATFGSAAVKSLEFHGGSGGNAVTLVDTMTSPSLQQVVLNTGLGADTVNVEQTHTNVVVNGQKGADVVNVGKGGSVQGITRQLTVTNLGNWSTLNLDNSADAEFRSRTVTLDVGSYGTVNGLAPGLIRFRRQDLRALNIWGGSGHNTY